MVFFNFIRNSSRNRVVIPARQSPNLITLFVVPARQVIHRLAESIPWSRFLSSLNVYKFRLRQYRLAEFIPWNRFLGPIKVLNYRLGYIAVILVVACCWRYFACVTAVACIQTVTGILAVAGGPAVIGFPAVASIPADSASLF